MQNDAATRVPAEIAARVARLMMTELVRQYEASRTTLYVGSDDSDLTDFLIDGRVDLIALAMAAIPGAHELHQSLSA